MIRSSEYGYHIAVGLSVAPIVQIAGGQNIHLENGEGED